MITLSVLSMFALASAAPAPPPEAEPAPCALAATATEQSVIRLDLNIPAYRLDVYAAERRSSTFTVAVGMPKYRTPTGTYRITTVTWDPWWFPPPSEWARDEKPIPPGPDNPMGRVKLQFGPLLFVHGTPNEASLGTAASHACVRMADRDAVDLARLVHVFASPDLSPEALDSLVAERGRTRDVTLRYPVPLTIRYEIAEVRDESLLIHPDVYGRVRRVRDEVLGALARAGYPAAMIDPEVLAELIARSRLESVSLPLGSLAGGGVR